MGASRFITPTINVEMDALAALVFEEVLATEVSGLQGARIHMGTGENSANTYVTGQTPWTFLHDLGFDDIAAIQQSSIYRDALQRCRDTYEQSGIIMFAGIPTE
ncbi:hypothetical protein CWT12_06600 [Actinomyces sp. 432]|uniref:hypothetical protein n=1 Tax=Actinomyces sp. 432 TaxID=2057798 RepID=UPI0013741529|nr:hypothetical protein [Actinomyces sp. 432]QHO91058.1 hypothetical protein CWT12_06600 [Actinomyces sp. 432]